MRKTVGRWTGNGGRMANSKQEKLEAAGKKQVRTAKKKEPSSGCDLDCSNCTVSGAKTLRKIACQTVKEKSAAIAQSLSEKASAGDLNSAKLLLALMDAKAEKADAKKK